MVGKMKCSENEISKKLFEIYKSLLEYKPSSESYFNQTESENQIDEDELTILFLKEELERRNIISLSQLPLKQKNEIIELANILPANKLLFGSIQKLGLTESIGFPMNGSTLAKCKSNNPFKDPIPYLTGTCFHLNSNQSLPESTIFDLSEVSYPTIIGYDLPKYIECSRIGKIYNTFRIFPNWRNYIHHRHKELKIPMNSKDIGLWKGEPKVGYNISHKKQYGDIAFTFVREFRQFSLTITDKIQLSEEYLRRLNEVISYTTEDYFGIKQWEDFFTEFGTHVVYTANGGGRIVITVLENNLKNHFSTEDLTRKESEIEKILANLLEFEELNRTNNNKNPIETLLISSIRLEGGSPNFHSLDLTNCKTTKEMRQIIKDWTETLKHDFIMLDTSISVVPIVEILYKHNRKDEAKMLDEATKKILGKSYYKIPVENSSTSRWPFW